MRSAYYPNATLRRQLAALDFVPTHVSDQMLRGTQASRRRGSGLEFRQYRAYQQGDDARRIDWKQYGRTDKLYIRESDEDRRLVITFVIDASASMSVVDANGMRRLDAARYQVAALAWLAMHKHHEFCLVELNGDRVEVLPPGQGTDHYHRLLAHLDGLEAKGQWRESLFRDLVGRLPQRMLLVMVSDFFEHNDEHRRGIAELIAQSHATLLLQLLLPLELDWSVNGQVEVIDVETNQRRLVASRRFRSEYRRRLKEMLEELRLHFQAVGARFVRASTTTPVGEVARAMLTDDLRAEARLLTDVSE
ncbi:MAG: DUF58 domain-containing protein [Pseudomonadota bacterium]